MRLAVLSDVHGNLPALEAVLAELDQTSLDGILVLGDLVAGPHAPETIALLRERGCAMIRGNNDSYCLHYAQGLSPESWYTSKQFALHRWNQRRLTSELLDFFASLPEQRVIRFDGANPIRMVHGSPRHPSEGLDAKLGPEALRIALSMTPEPALACGHTHIPWQGVFDGKLAFNPGAVSGALNGDNRAQYALLEWQGDRWQVQHRAAAYDLARLRREFVENGLLEEGNHIARALLLGCLTGKNVGQYLLRHARRLAEAEGVEVAGTFPDDLWDRAGETFPWEQYEA